MGQLRILDLLIIFGADINKKVVNGYTALFYAALKGHSHIIKRLIETKNCVLDEVDEKGHTALDVAIKYGYYNSALILVKNGLRTKSVDFYEL